MPASNQEPFPASGWMTVDLGGLARGWTGHARPALETVVPPAPAAPREEAEVVSLAAHREAEAARTRRVPEVDILVLDRARVAPGTRAPEPAEILDLADLAPVPADAADRAASPPAPTERATPAPEPIPFPSGAGREAHERRRRILYLAAAAIILASGAIHTYRHVGAARVISIPVPDRPGHMLS